MVCNPGMNDSQLIDELGGPTKVSDLLGYRRLGGVQRVQNWKLRGIPARVKLQRPDLFLRGQSAAEDAPAPATAVPTPAAAEAGHAG